MGMGQSLLDDDDEEEEEEGEEGERFDQDEGEAEEEWPDLGADIDLEDDTDAQSAGTADAVRPPKDRDVDHLPAQGQARTSSGPPSSSQSNKHEEKLSAKDSSSGSSNGSNGFRGFDHFQEHFMKQGAFSTNPFQVS